jgi:hypothetical protein
LFAIIAPFSLVDGAIQVFKASVTFDLPVAQVSLVCAYAKEEHKTLALKVASDKISFIIVSIFEVEDAFAPDQVVLPVTLESVSVSVMHGTVPILCSIIEVAFIAVAILTYQDATSVHAVCVPLTIVD